MRAAIFGAGAMGTVLGAYLTKAGGQVDLIARNVEHVNTLNTCGAHITGTVDFVVPVNALLPEQMTGKYDVIILFTKQRNNGETVASLLPYLADDGVMCTCQNGLPEPSVAAVVGEERCVGCAVSWGATLIKSGCAALTSKPKKLSFALGSPYGNNPKLADVASLLSLMGKVRIYDNFLGARWAKLAINGAFSPLSAISGLTFGQIANDKRYRRLAQILLKEAFTTAQSAGVKVGKVEGFSIQKLFDYKGKCKQKLSFALLPLAMRKHAGLVSGMYYDLQKGKPCDIDFINGVILQTATQNGAQAPLHAAVVEIAHQIERGERTLGEQNLLDLRQKFE